VASMGWISAGMGRLIAAAVGSGDKTFTTEGAGDT